MIRGRFLQPVKSTVRRGYGALGRRLDQSLRKAFVRITGESLDSTLRSLIPNRVSILFMHSSLSRCGYIVGGAATVIDAVFGYCETLCLPTHTYCYPTASGTAAPTFNVQSSPSCVGRITEEFRRMPGAIRSIHPTHSLASIGPGAKELGAGHERCDTPCGRGTPYEKMVQSDASVLMFGASMQTYTLFHTAEDAAACEYLYEPQPYNLRAVDYFGNLHHVRMWRQDMTVKRRFREMDRILEAEGLLRRATLKKGELLYLPSAKRVHEFIVEQLSRDPYYLTTRSRYACAAG